MQPNISNKDLETWANYLLDHSLSSIKPEDVVMIKGEHICWPLISILQDKIFAAGAIADRIITVGMGESRPIASNETAAGRQQNRRVELTLVPLTLS